MEGAHGELRPGLADRLRGDDTDSLSEIDRRTPGKIAPVAFAADSIPRLACEGGPNLDLLHACILKEFDLLLLEQFAALDNGLAGGRMLHVLGRGTSEHARAERDGHLAGLDDRSRGNPIRGAAIFLGDDA